MRKLEDGVLLLIKLSLHKNLLELSRKFNDYYDLDFLANSMYLSLGVIPENYRLNWIEEFDLLIPLNNYSHLNIVISNDIDSFISEIEYNELSDKFELEHRTLALWKEILYNSKSLLTGLNLIYKLINYDKGQNPRHETKFKF